MLRKRWIEILQFLMHSIFEKLNCDMLSWLSENWPPVAKRTARNAGMRVESESGSSNALRDAPAYNLKRELRIGKDFFI